MKTIFFLTSLLLLRSGIAFTQDFRALPPAEQPNAAELAYFGGKNPNWLIDNSLANSQLVKDFLTDLTTGQFEAAHQRMADGFIAYGPGYNDKLETDSLLAQWDRDSNLFADQHLAVESSSVTTVPTGNNRGTWVYLKMVWSATERSGQGKPVRILFHQLARINNGLIERTYTSYGNDQIFYDLGIGLYANPSGVAQRP